MSAQATAFPENMHDYWFCKKCHRRGFVSAGISRSDQLMQAILDHYRNAPDCLPKRYEHKIIVLTDREVFRSQFGFDYGRDFVVQFHAAPIIPRQLELAL